MRIIVTVAVSLCISLTFVSSENMSSIPSPTSPSNLINSLLTQPISSQPISPQPASTPSALASKSLLLDISPAGKDKLVAVGQYGHILLSTDGDNWQQANVPVQSTLTSVFFLNEQLGWAVGHDSTILRSQDGGLNWQVQQYLPSLEKPLLDIYFKNSLEGIAIGAYGQFYRTNDGGATWKSEFYQEFLSPEDIEYLTELKQDDEEAYLDEISFILPHFNGLTFVDDTLYLVGENGLVATSQDFGLSWQAFENFYQGSFLALAQTNVGSLSVVGLRGHVFSSSIIGADNELTWDEISTGSTALLNDIVLSPDGRIYVLGNNGVLLVSMNDGKTFVQAPQPDGKPLIAGAWFKNSLFVVSDVGIKTIELPE